MRASRAGAWADVSACYRPPKRQSQLNRRADVRNGSKADISARSRSGADTRGASLPLPLRCRGALADDGQADPGAFAAGEHLLRGRAVVAWLGEEDVGDVGLRVAVVEGEPARLDLDHQAVAGLDHVIDVGQREF